MKLPKVVALSLTVTGGASAAHAQGTLANLANSLGGTIYPLFFGDTFFKGPDYRVEVFTYDAAKPGGFGAQLGGLTSIGSNGRFNAGDNVAVPNVNPGDTAQLIVRAWNQLQSGANSYDDASQHYVTAPFRTGILGGLPPGSPSPIPLLPGNFATGLPDGFNGALSLAPATPFGVFASLANNAGDRVFYAFAQDGVTPLTGDRFKIEVFSFDAGKAGGFGSQLGTAVSPASNGRFNAGNDVRVYGANPGQTTQLIVRAWDTTTGATYDTATARGTSLNFVSTALGGDPDGEGPLLPLPGTSMTSGLPNGFQGFKITSPTYGPSVGLIGRLDNLATDGRLIPIYNVDGTSPITGNGFKVEIFTYNPDRPGGFGTQLGTTMNPNSAGRFGVGQFAQVPGTIAGQSATLVVRAWDVSTGSTFDNAKIKGVSQNFMTGILGGDPDGSGPLQVINPTGMTTGTATGFQSFSLYSPPDIGLIGELSNKAGDRIVPVFGPDGTTILTGSRYKVEVFTYDSLKTGGFDQKVGVTSTFDTQGAFNSGVGFEVPSSAAGQVSRLIVRAWDTTTGLSYDQAKVKGTSQPFLTGILGGDPDGPGPRQRIDPTGMTTGTATGFQSFSLNAPPVPPGPGTIALLSNTVDGQVVPIFEPDGVTKLVGSKFKVEVYTYDSIQPGGFGVKLGVTTRFDSTGAFYSGTEVEVPGTTAGKTSMLVVRAWDTTTGLTYNAARVRGQSVPFTTDILGGDPDGSGPLKPIASKGMTTGTASGFQSFSLYLPPGPGSIALLSNSVGNQVVPVFETDGLTQLAGSRYKVEVFTYDGLKAGGFGTQLGETTTFGVDGQFNAGSDITVPNSLAGQTATLIVRAWDSTTGDTYGAATKRGASQPFVSDILGGDPDGSGPLGNVAAKGMASGKADGFRSFQIASTPPPPPDGTGKFGVIATLSNNNGNTVIPLYYADGSAITSANPDILVEVFVYNENVQGGFGTRLGGTVSIGARGRFNAGSNVLLPNGGGPGETAKLIVRAWDKTTGATYDSAGIKGNSGPFRSDILGGDPDGDGPLLPITGKTLASGANDGFRGFAIGFTAIPEPGTVTLGAVGGVALLAGLRGRREKVHDAR